MKNINYIIKSINLNYKSWIALLVSSYFICDYNIISGCINYLIGLLYIYFGHIFYHSPCSTFYYYIHTYHHDHHDVNGILYEVIMEFTGTMMPIIVCYCLLNWRKIHIGFNPYVYLFFAFFYSTVHIINYTFLKCNNMHMDHHKNINGNYFPDICDLIFETKHVPEDIENTDHWIPNIIGVTLFVLLIKYMYRNIENKKNINLICFIIYGLMYDSVIIFGLYYMINDIFNNDSTNDNNFNKNILNVKNKIYNRENR